MNTQKLSQGAEHQPSIRLPFTQLIEVANGIQEYNYSILPSLLSPHEIKSKEWEEFRKSWDNLCMDTCMKDGGTYRYRRYSVFSWLSEQQQLIVESKQPHYQTLDYNPLNGGVERNFEAFENSVTFSPILNRVMSFYISVLDRLHCGQDWHIEAHQFRITTGGNVTGLPTPEGIHQDGRNYVLMMFIDRQNIVGGKTTVFDLQKTPLLEHELSYPSETMFVNDEAVMHGVSPIHPKDPNIKGIRDVLVITFYKKPFIH